MVLVGILKFNELFLIAILRLNKVSDFDCRVCIFFYCLDWKSVSFVFTKKKDIMLFDY